MPFGGGILQLVAKGQQDKFLTGNPEMTFFKMMYKRHTNFSITQRRMFFDGTPDFGQRVTCTVPPGMGDLLGKTYLHVMLPRLSAVDKDGNKMPVSYCNGIGHALIDEITLFIGEQQIDQQNGEWMEIWTQLKTPASQVDALNTMIGKVDGYMDPNLLPGSKSEGLELWIPLQFFFCKDSGLYIPLMAIQFYKIKIAMTISPLSSLFYTPLLVTDPDANILEESSSIVYLELVSEFINLDTEERRKFVSSPHEYLIEQIEYTPIVPVPSGQQSFSIRSEFTNPVKEFFLVVQRDYMTEVNQPFNYSSLAGNEIAPAVLADYFPLGSTLRTDLIKNVMMQLDGIDCFEDPLNAFYLSIVQPYQYHTRTPVDKFIYTYSISLFPEKITPSGSFNASRINALTWNVNINPILLMTGVNIGNLHARLYAINYNVLRVVEGFAGVLFKA